MRAWLLTASLVLAATPVSAQRSAMREPRFDHDAVSLGDGRVLVAGGQRSGEGALASAEIFEGGRWRAIASLGTRRAGASLTQLADGRVLAIGGHDRSTWWPSAEVWDPTTDRWSPIAPMHQARAYHAAVRLADGRVLVAGGSDRGTTLASAETWSPETGAWTPTTPMSGPRGGDSVALLGDGRVLIAGAAYGDQRADDLDLYDPQRDAWRAIRGPLGALEAVVALPDGRALVLGHGQPSRYVADSRDARAALWDPITERWTDAGSAGSAPWARDPSVVALPDGRVVVAGGSRWAFPSAAAAERAYAEACEGVHVPMLSVRDVFVWSGPGRWSRGPPLRQPRVHAAAARLEGRTVLLTGGEHYHYGWSGLVRRSIELVSPR